MTQDDLGEIEGYAVLGEEFYRIGDHPIMCCVLMFAEEFHVVGFSMSSTRLFDEELARPFSRRNARASAPKQLHRRFGFAKATE